MFDVVKVALFRVSMSYQRVNAFATKSQRGATKSKSGHNAIVATEAAIPAANPMAVIVDAVTFGGTYWTSFRQNLDVRHVMDNQHATCVTLRTWSTHAYGCNQTSRRD